MVNISTCHKTFIEKQIIVIKNLSLISNLLYVNIVSPRLKTKAITKIIFSITMTSIQAFNKVNTIIIKIDNKNNIWMFNTKFFKNIV